MECGNASYRSSCFYACIERGWCNLASWHERRLDLLALQDEQKQEER